MNRVLRSPELAAAPSYFGGDEPRFYDENVQALVEQAEQEAYARGRADGAAEARANVGAAVARLDAALNAAGAELRRTHLATVEETLAAAIDVARFVIGRAPHDEGVAVAERVLAALDTLDDESVVVTVHPGDWEAVSGAVTVPQGVTVERDPGLHPGEARIRGTWAAVDMTREAALRVATEVLG